MPMPTSKSPSPTKGVDKDLQPAMTKSLGKIQKDVQSKEASATR